MPIKKIVINETPLPQPRARITRWGNFDPLREKKLWWKSIIAEQVDEVLSCPLEIETIFFMKIPKSTSKKKKAEMISGEIKHIKLPDVDNLYKAVSDAMNEVVYKDDSQIWNMHAIKQYDENPRIEVVIKY
jgi:Holliday junction resolvase RusA-like endonuclease